MAGTGRTSVYVSLSLSLCTSGYGHIYIYICTVYIYIYIYVNIQVYILVVYIYVYTRPLHVDCCAIVVGCVAGWEPPAPLGPVGGGVARTVGGGAPAKPGGVEAWAGG